MSNYLLPLCQLILQTLSGWHRIEKRVSCQLLEKWKIKHLYSIKLSRINNRFNSSKIWFCRLYLIFSPLTVPQSLDPQDGRADDEAELQDWQDNQQTVNASCKHLVRNTKRVNFTMFKHVCLFYSNASESHAMSRACIQIRSSNRSACAVSENNNKAKDIDINVKTYQNQRTALLAFLPDHVLLRRWGIVSSVTIIIIFAHPYPNICKVDAVECNGCNGKSNSC